MKLRKHSQSKSRKGLRGSEPYSKRIPIELTCWVLTYDIMVEKNSGNFPEFSNFSVFIIHSFYVPHSGLIKLTVFFILLKISSPQKYINTQKPKHAQNGLKLS